MTKTFTGALLLPGEAGTGLDATLSLDPERVTLTAGDSQLGSWDRADYLITPESNGAFGLTLGGETLLFRPDSPAEFSGTSAIPLVGPQAEPLVPKAKKPKADTKSRSEMTDDDYLNMAIAGVRPIKDLNDDGGISRGFVTIMGIVAGVISIAAVVTAALA